MVNKFQSCWIFPLLGLLGLGLLGISSLSGQVWAQSNSPEQKEVAKVEIHLSVGFSVPPYVITGQNRGAELDIVREAFGLKNYEIVPFYVSNKRRNREYSDGITDGALTVSRSEDIDGYFSKTYISYQNVAISLASRHLEIMRVSDLRDKSIIAFQTASKILGADFTKAIANARYYKEVAKQREQILHLFSGDVDVVVGDINILRWFVNNSSYPERLNTKQPIAVHQIFPPGKKYAVFHDQRLTRTFDKGIEALKESGRYDEILQSYGFDVRGANDPS